MATAIGENIDSARDFWVQSVTRTAEARFWTPEESAAAFVDIEEAYDDVTGFESFSYTLGGFFGSANAGELQVLTFTSALAERAKNWTAPGSAEIQAALAEAVGQNVDQAGRTTSTVYDEVMDTKQAAAETAKDFVKRSTDPTTYVLIAATALAVLLLFARVR